MRKLFPIALAGALALGGCATTTSSTTAATVSTDVVQSVFAAETAYNLAAQAEVAYAATKPGAAKLAAMKAADNTAYAALVNLRTAAMTGNATTVALAAATTAIGNITTTTGGTP